MNGHDSIILAAGSNVVTSALDLFSQFAIIGGGLWAVWAVYAARDLHKDGAVITAKGDKLAGSGFDSEKFGGDLFTLDYKDGTAVITATDAYRALVSVHRRGRVVQGQGPQAHRRPHRRTVGEAFSIPSSEPLRVRRERPNRSLLDGHTVVMSSKTSRKETIMYGTTIAADSGSVVTSALQLFSQFAIIGGGLWAVWGVITLAGGLKDQNGPATQSGVWQVVGGGLIIAAAALFSNIAL